MQSRKILDSPRWSKIVSFYKSQKNLEIETQKRTLSLIKAMEAEKEADRLGTVKPSQMSAIDKRRREFLSKLGPRGKAYLGLFGIDARLYPGEKLFDEKAQGIFSSFPSTTAIFAPFGMSFAIAATIGSVPSLTGLAAGATAAFLIRAAAVARNLEISVRPKIEKANIRLDSENTSGVDPVLEQQLNNEPSLSSFYEFRRSELRSIQVFGSTAGLATLACLVQPTPAVLLIPAFAVLHHLSPSTYTRNLFFTIGAPLGLLTGPYFDQVSPEYLGQLAILMWASTATARGIFSEKVKNLFFPAAAVTGLWTAGFFLGGLHRSFAIFGIPASAGLLAQVYSNKYRTIHGQPQESFENLNIKEILFWLAFLTAFTTSRACSQRQGFVFRDTEIVVGGAAEDVGVVV